MRLRRHHRSLAAVIAILLLLTGCGELQAEKEEPQDDDTTGDLAAQVREPAYKADQIFTLQYTPDETMNPFETQDVFNEQVTGLVYEGLFVLDEKLEPQLCLAESFTTVDGVQYIITLRSDAVFHDGGTLTAKDVVYSLSAARLSDKYSSRLSCIESSEALDELTVKVTLRYPNYMLPSLLDTPIVREGTAENAVPTGTGPYRLDVDRLRVFRDYRSPVEGLPAIIYLEEKPISQLVESLLNCDLDLLASDPTGLMAFNVYTIHETRSYATTDLVYLGINTQQGALAEDEFRRALSYLVDRGTICGEIYGGLVEEAPLVLNPVLEYYDEAWEEDTDYSRLAFLEAANFIGLEDIDADGFLEYYGDINLKLIVNDDSTYKTAAAQRIATDLTNMGIKTELAILTWDEYMSALREGDFDLYLGETRLKADFDLTPLLSPEGSMNYGGVEDELFEELVRKMQGAEDETSREAAAEELCMAILDQAPIVPIAFKKYQVLTRVGEITGLAPSQSNIFRNIADWTFNGFK